MLKSLSLPFVILGLVLFLFGFIAVTAPNMNVLTLMLYLAYMLIAVGAITASVGFMLRKSTSKWWISPLLGVVLLILGLSIFLHTEAAATYYTILIATWACLMGLSLMTAAMFQQQLKVILVVNGCMSLGFGCVIYFNPFTGTNTLNFMVGFYTLLLSVMLLYVAFKLSRFKQVNDSVAE
jgi:uncharacterized membrane protein HdeD (DUF308 family)